ncbi:nucleocapsid protein [Mammarenavirus lujoense]|uniref:Nucleocapsid protein n=1 Tax=Mammarenavirus lujoense TaxID=3052314 RepID=C5ILC2_9VIRU|nr:nucleocapsid protein [Mammarenavirus lujoense]ACR56360.1 nucleocapsid protein [Mammarenavirus lujoense]AFP21515.1 nucleoprotein [Mammarenavirus lujoense]
MSQSKEVKSFLWLQTLRRELSPFCTDVRAKVVKDAVSLINGLDFSMVSDVQRLMRKDKRNDEDLMKLRELNQTVDGLVDLKSSNKKNRVGVGKLTSDELMILATDLEKLKKKVTRTEARGPGVYRGNLSQDQLGRRSELLNMIGMGTPRPTRNTVVRVWDVKDSSLLNNQFGTMPSLTLACLTRQTRVDLNDSVQACVDLGLIYTAKFPNMDDLDKLKNKHPVLDYVSNCDSAINISGYNLSLASLVKAGASLMKGGDMLETIELNSRNIDDVIKATLTARNKVQMFVSEVPGERNPYENLLYKICLSGEGWPYISSRTSIKGRSWDNTVIDMTPKDPTPPQNERAKAPHQFPVGVSFSQSQLLDDIMKNLNPKGRTWMDIEGRPDDPVEIAIFQPEERLCLHFYREPTDQKQFKNDSKYCHGMDFTQLCSTQPGLTTAVLERLPLGMVITCQGKDDIEKLLHSQGRRDVKFIDIQMSKEASRKFEDQVWDSYKTFCNQHTGIVVTKSKKGKKEITPHCALMDCIMYESAVNGQLYQEPIRNLLPADMIFRTAAKLSL